MNNEAEKVEGSWLVHIAFAVFSMPILYVLSWGPVGVLAQRFNIESEALETSYYPIRWTALTVPGMFEPLKWYWERFDFLRPDPDARARQLIYATESP